MASLQVLVHEGVVSRGRGRVLGSLRSICDLQAALGANRMILDLRHIQSMQAILPFESRRWERCCHAHVFLKPMLSAIITNY
jgi:hypothetical protein